MFDGFLKNTNIFNQKPDMDKAKERAIELLKTNPEAFERFEEVYKVASLRDEEGSDNFFDKGKAVLDKDRKKSEEKMEDIDWAYINSIVSRIVDELLLYPVTESEEYKSGKIKLVTLDEVNKIPLSLRPQLTGTMVIKDVEYASYPMVLFYYSEYLKTVNEKKKKMLYNQFLMGLDTLDLDPVNYEILGRNLNSFGNWYPALEAAVSKSDFFKLPKTKYIKVPLPILQLTRLGYETLNDTTKRIVNQYCMRAFDLDINKDYFIKTGTFSFKFDFRNCKVTKGKEVEELGEYLLFIQNYAINMSSYLSSHPIVGVSTTNEWVVREYIEDLENNPCIYKGLPLHTEYRLFIDCDSDEVIGKAPYWDIELLTKRFSEGSDKDSADKKHDYISVQIHKDVLMKRYKDNIERVVCEANKLVKDLDLKGQWSLDIMQNGDDFYIIDMALASQSALYDCVPLEKRNAKEIDWMPKLGK